MRLTVRTLLAYLDHVLPEEANEVLAAKLRESLFATQLAERIKASIKRSDLSAPGVGAVHPIEDANTIAEYLDNALQAENIPEVERVLLESDVHLSEAAACHQILTLVLSRPALVPHELREKISRLAESLPGSSDAASIGVGNEPFDAASVASLDLPVSDVSALQASVADPIAAMPTAAAPFRSAVADGTGANHPQPNGRPANGSPASRKADVPEYLRAGRPARILPWLMTLGLCAVLLFIISKAFQPVARLATDDASIHTSDDPLLIYRDDLPAPNFGPAGEQADEVVVENGDKPKPEATAEGGLSSVDIPKAEPPKSEAPRPDMPEPDASERSDVTPEKPSTVVEVPTESPSRTMTDENSQPKDSPAPTGSSSPPASETAPAEPVVSEVTPAPTAAPTAEMAAADSAAGENDPVIEKPVPTEPVAAAQDSQQAGVLESADTILVKRTETGWSRVKKDEAVFTDVDLVNLPTFRSTILLDDGLKLTSVGPAEFSLGPAGDAAAIDLIYGRFLFQSQTPDTTVSLKVAGRKASLHLPDVDAQAAVHVTVFRPQGADPAEADSRQHVIAAQAVEGTVGWTIQDAEEVALASPVRWIQIGTAEPVSDRGDSVAWPKAPAANEVSLDSMSRKGLLELIDDSKSIEITLRESAGYRRAEVAALGARCLLLIGVSDIYFGANGIFANDAQKSHWQEHFKAVQAELDRGGPHAERVRESIARKNAVEGGKLYRLLWGYSPEQLAAGADFALVEALNDAALATRVLALENLREITGTTLNYRPQETSPRRAAAAKKWDTKLAAEDIRWQQPPTALTVLSQQ